MGVISVESDWGTEYTSYRVQYRIFRVGGIKSLQHDTRTTGVFCLGL